MQISTSSNNVIIQGNIKSISDFQEIKKTLDLMSSSENKITILIEDSISITSSIIGYLNKLVLKDGITLQVKVGNNELYELLDDVNLLGTLKVRKV